MVCVYDTNALAKTQKIQSENDAIYQTLWSSRVFCSMRNSPHVAIAATTAFASLWLMPRLGNFWSEHQAFTLNHSISDNPEAPVFLNADIRIRYGSGQWSGEVATWKSARLDLFT